MFSVGILYLQFEKSILFFPPKKWSAGQPSPPPTPGSNSFSQSILGVQIGLILLAMVVTWSSIASLQAKRGLPLGNQVVGWLVLSTISPILFHQIFTHERFLFLFLYFFFLEKKGERIELICYLYSRIIRCSSPPRLTAK